MARLTKLALAYIEQWQKLEQSEREQVLNFMSEKRHAQPSSSLTNAYATASYLLAALDDEEDLPSAPSRS